VTHRFVSRLIRQEAAARDTGTFYFEKPPGFAFTAGQFIDLALPLTDAPDTDRIHTFSLSSAPYEDHLAITTRLRDTRFKRTLRALTPEDGVDIEGPYGTFVVSPHTSRPVVFLIGGVGVTPAFSIIKQAAHDAELDEMYLFYSNRGQAEAPFLAYLQDVQREHQGFHLVAVMTDEPSWNGEKERIDIDMIRRYIDPSRGSFYSSGPPGMVRAMRDMLARSGVQRERVFFENFTGY